MLPAGDGWNMAPNPMEAASCSHRARITPTYRVLVGRGCCLHLLGLFSCPDCRCCPHHSCTLAAGSSRGRCAPAPSHAFPAMLGSGQPSPACSPTRRYGLALGPGQSDPCPETRCRPAAWFLLCIPFPVLSPPSPVLGADSSKVQPLSQDNTI